MRERHFGDDVTAKPVDAALGGEIVDGGRIAAGIDRPAHQRHREWDEGIAFGFHDRNRRHHRNRRLAHRDHVRVAAEHVQHLDDVIDVVVEIETAGCDGNHPGIGPVGDVDLMRRQKGFDRAAQQRRVMAGHRRHDQHARLRRTQRPGQFTIEIQQATERFFPDRADLDRGADAADLGIVQTPFGFAVTAGGALEQFAPGGNRFAELGARPRIERILKQDFGRIGNGPRRIERGLRHFIHPVHRRRKRRTAFGHQWRCAAKLTNRHVVLKSLLHRSIVPNA